METTIKKLAERLGGNLWIKEDKKRIYLDRGYNTKKMSTKTYVYQREDGTYGVSCYIECSSQPYAWIKSQQQEIIDNVFNDIERIIEEQSSEFVYAVVKNNEYYYDIDNSFGLDLWQIDDDNKIYSREKADKIAEAVGGEVVQYSKEEFQAMIDKAEEIRAAEQLKKQIEQIETKPKEEVTPTVVDYLKEYCIGSNYKHSKFGIGVLISEDKNTVVIKFEVGEKHLLKQFAKLEQA